MRWNKMRTTRWKSGPSAPREPQPMSAGFSPSGRILRPHHRALLISAPLLLAAILLLAAAPDKHLSVYSTAANYSLPVVQRDRRDYVGLLEVLEPLGKVSAKFDGQRWRLRYNNRVEGDFFVGKTRIRVQGHDAELPARFLLENDRGLVPVSSLASLLPRFLGGPVTVHEDSDRLFIGSIATHFTASLAGDNPPKLVFHFTTPVNPSVSPRAGSVAHDLQPRASGGARSAHVDVRQQSDSLGHVRRNQRRRSHYRQLSGSSDRQFQR